MRVVWILGVALSALGAGCATTFSSWNEQTFAPIRAASLPPIDDQPARLLLQEKIVAFDEHDGAIVAREFVHTKARIHNARGQAWREAVVVHDRTFTTVEAFDARVTLPNGEPMVFSDDDLIDVPMLGTDVLYSDTRVRRLKINEVPPGSVVEVASITRRSQPELFAFVQVFGADIPIDTARFVVEAPMAWSIEVLAERGGEIVDWPAHETLIDGRRRLVWELIDVAPLLPDASAPAYGELVDRVTVRLQRATTKTGTIVAGPRDAIELSRLTAAMTAPSVRDTPALRAIVQEVIGPAPTSLPPRERAAKLYAWVRDRIRYCAIEIGIGGFVPHAADEVEGLRYGDCKDKANLLKSLLQVAGIESRLVTIYADRSPRRFRLPVVAANFNHAILVVDLPEGPAFVDPTTRTVPFGDLPPWDEERECLPISAAGSDVVMTPASSPDTDQRDLRCTLAATPEGRANGTCHLELLGSFADAAREQFLSAPPEQHRTVVDGALQLRRATVKEHAGDGLAPPLFPTPARLDATIELDLTTSATSHPEFVTAAMLVRSDLLPSLPPSRPAHDVVFRGRRRQTDAIVIKLPSTHHVRQLPPPTTIDGPLASFQVAWRADGDALVLERRLTIHSVRVPAARVDELRVVVDAWDRASEARVLLARAPTTTTTSPAPSLPGVR
jgi:hypothetical protein